MLRVLRRGRAIVAILTRSDGSLVCVGAMARATRRFGQCVEVESRSAALIDDEVLRIFGNVLPRSEYTVLLLEISPRLVAPESPSDYFSHEQVTTWGVDPVAGSSADPGTSYYRTFETPIGNDRHLHEMVVPMVPPPGTAAIVLRSTWLSRMPIRRRQPLLARRPPQDAGGRDFRTAHPTTQPR